MQLGDPYCFRFVSGEWTTCKNGVLMYVLEKKKNNKIKKEGGGGEGRRGERVLKFFR